MASAKLREPNNPAAEHPFAEVERWLEAPTADGLMLVSCFPDSPWLPAGWRPGDLVTAVGEKPVDSVQALYRALQPKGADDKVRTLTRQRVDGSRGPAEAPTAISGTTFCRVQRGQPGWQNLPDYTENPAIEGLADGREFWSLNSLADGPAGYEHIKLAQRDGKLEVTMEFTLGGEAGPGKTWEYRTRMRSTHRLEAHLPTIATAFYEGAGADEHCVGDITLGEDGRWRGTRTGKAGAANAIDRAASAALLVVYAAPLIPLLMPFRAGATCTVLLGNDGIALPTERCRFECLGRRQTTVAGESAEAWCFAWRHYGVRSEERDEKFYLSDDRDLLRIEWGQDYGGCVTEKMSREKIFTLIPKKLRD